MIEYEVAVPVEAYKIVKVVATHDADALKKAEELYVLLDSEGGITITGGIDPWKKSFALRRNELESYRYYRKNPVSGRWEQVEHP